MEKRALLIGIDSYNSLPSLSGCVSDATQICSLLERNEDGSPNYDCRLITDGADSPITRSTLRKEWQRLFHDFTGDVLFYFSGHGVPTEFGGYLVTQDGALNDFGVAMSDLLWVANQSKAREILIILDCCYSLYPGRSAKLNDAFVENYLQLREGITILAASTPVGLALETQAGGVFSNLVKVAIAGGAADVRGCVTSASIYAYVEQVLGAWDQRTLFQSHVSRFGIVRRCKPLVPDEILRELLLFFPAIDFAYQLNPSYDATHDSAETEHVHIFSKFKLYRDGQLLKSASGGDLSFGAINSDTVQLTPLGQFYWRLAKAGRL